MSGTLGNIRKQREQLLAGQRRAAAEQRRQEALQANREAVIAEVCRLFGWSKLDDFAQKMIDDAFAGELVDIEQLKADIAAWQSAQERSDSAGGDDSNSESIGVSVGGEDDASVSI